MPDEESTLKVSRGSVNFRTEKRLTMEDVSNLASAGKVIGIPPTARINHMSFQFGFGMSGEACEISISWDIES